MTTVKIRWYVPDLAVVMASYDTQKVYRSTDGTYSEITDAGTRVDLVAGQTNYQFEDSSGDRSYLYKVTFYNTSTQAESDLANAITAYFSSRFINRADLDSLIGSGRVDQFFDDDVSGSAAEEEKAVHDVMLAAEEEMISHLMRSFSGGQIEELIAHDRALRRHVAWVALEYASQRRPDFCAGDGSGAFSKQHDRAISFFRALGKGNLRSSGESAAGKSSRIGGAVQPTVTAGEPRFVFAPDRRNPGPHGNF